MKDMTLAQRRNLPENPTLSVCMIVRDEERVLSRCLKSIQDVADELVVVDTGSKDKTISIAKDFGAKVFHFEWCDDFAAARNESLKHATGDWILQIDADEELPQQSKSPLRKAMRNAKRLCHLIMCDDGSAAAQRFGWIARLFRNHPSVKYSRPYHESVQQSVELIVAEEPHWEIGYEPDVVIRHYGYEPSKLVEKKTRGLHIMESYLKTHPKDWYVWSKLGGVYSGLEDYDKAEVFLNRALELNPNYPEANHILGCVLEKQERISEAMECYKKAITGDPLLAEACVALGAIYVKKGLLDNAISELQRALSINPEFAQAYCNLGLAFVGKRRYADGISVLKKAIAIDPDLAAAYMNLGMAYTKRGMIDDGIAEYQRALAIDPDYAKAHYNLAIAFYVKGNSAKAVKHCDRAAELGAEIHPQLAERLAPFR